MTWLSATRACSAAVALLALVGLSPAFAVNVQPLALDMVSIGPNSRASIQVINDGAKPMPVEVIIKKLDIGEDGKTSEIPAGDEFLVFPPQAVVPAGSTQGFRVQWVGARISRKARRTWFS